MDRRKFLQRLGLIAAVPVVAKAIPVEDATVIRKTMPASVTVSIPGPTGSSSDINFRMEGDRTAGFVLSPHNSDWVIVKGEKDA